MIYNIKLTKEEAQDILEYIPDTNISIRRKLLAIVNLEEKPVGGRSLQDDSVKQSQGHKIIASLLKDLFPGNNIKQNSRVQLKVGHVLKNCEFDIVDYTLNIIFEIQGSQHYQFNKFFHKDKEDFQKQQTRDEAKIDWALENGWYFVSIKDSDAKKLKAGDAESVKILAKIIDQTIKEKESKIE